MLRVGRFWINLGRVTWLEESTERMPGTQKRGRAAVWEDVPTLLVHFDSGNTLRLLGAERDFLLAHIAGEGSR